MIIIQEYAEETLLKRIGEYIESSKKGYILYIHRSFFHTNDHQTFLDLIKAWIGEHSCEAFISHDKDLFLFAPHLTPKLYQNLKENIRVRLNYHVDFISKNLSHYEIEKNGEHITDIIKEKIANSLQAQLEQEKEEREKLLKKKQKAKENFQNIELPSHLLKTLQERKLARTYTEILIVEDDPFSQKLIGNVLNQFSVTCAEDGYRAINNYLIRAPNIVFLDIDLPDVTDHEVLHKILSFDPHASIVMLSGNSQSENVINAVNSGAKGFIGKPFTKDKLLKSVSKFAATRNMEGA